MVRAWWASGDSAPTLIADTTNRRAIERASSTAVSGTASPSGRTRSSSRGVDDAATGRASDARYRVSDVSIDGAGLSSLGERRGAREHLDLARDPRREQVRLPVGAEPRETRVGQARLAAGRWLRQGERRVTATDDALAEVGQRRPPRPRGCRREAALDDVGREVDRVDQRPADVARDRADPHPRQRLAQPGRERVDDVLDRAGRGQVLGAARAGELGGQLEREPRMDRGRADCQRHRHRMDVEHVGGIDDDVGPAAQATLRQRRVDRPRREDRRRPADDRSRSTHR